MNARISKLRDNKIDPSTFGSYDDPETNESSSVTSSQGSMYESKINRRKRWSFDNMVAEIPASIQEAGRMYGNNANEINTLYTQLKVFEKEVMEEFRQTIGCEKASIFFLDHEKQELVFLIHSQLYRLTLDEGIGGYVASTGEHVNIPDCYQDARFDPSFDKQTGYRTRNMMAQPIRPKMGSGKIIGVIEMINKYGDSPFTEHDETVLHQCVLHTADQLSSRFNDLLKATLRLSKDKLVTSTFDSVKSRYLEPRHPSSPYKTLSEVISNFQFRESEGNTRLQTNDSIDQTKASQVSERRRRYSRDVREHEYGL
jgi:hypothetical protein